MTSRTKLTLNIPVTTLASPLESSSFTHCLLRCKDTLTDTMSLDSLECRPCSPPSCCFRLEWKNHGCPSGHPSQLAASPAHLYKHENQEDVMAPEPQSLSTKVQKNMIGEPTWTGWKTTLSACCRILPYTP
jgi:hypothetical protein